jgi:hypothetical protein
MDHHGNNDGNMTRQNGSSSSSQEEASNYWARVLAQRIGCDAASLAEYIGPENDPAVQAARALDKRRTVFVSAADAALERDFERFRYLPNYDDLFGHYRYYKVGSDDITYVSGSVGSGKTLFALGAVARRLDDDYFWRHHRESTGMRELRVTVYVNLFHFQGFITDRKDDNERLQWLRAKLSRLVRVLIQKQLDMHISLVLDGAGLASVKGFFESVWKVCGFYSTMREHLASSFRLIVCGTAVHTRTFGGRDLKNIRMKPWSRYVCMTFADKIWCTGKGHISSFSNDMVEAICQHPILSTFTYNARCAYSLMAAVAKRINTRGYTMENWETILWECTGELVQEVVDHYITASNGLNALSTGQ